MRHTYLRVLHPLLTKTQLREVPYKRPQLLVLLESLTSNSRVREVNPTTRRLAERCLGGEWCQQLMELRRDAGYRVSSPLSDTSTVLSPPFASTTAQTDTGNTVMKNLKFSKSVEHLSTTKIEVPKVPIPRSPLDQFRAMNGSTQSIPSIMNQSTTRIGAPPPPKRRSTTVPQNNPPLHAPTPLVPTAHVVEPSSASSTSSASDEAKSTSTTARRRPPPPPAPKRRKPPAIPTHGGHGITITTIKTSESSPLSKVQKTAFVPS